MLTGRRQCGILLECFNIGRIDWEILIKQTTCCLVGSRWANIYMHTSCLFCPVVATGPISGIFGPVYRSKRTDILSSDLGEHPLTTTTATYPSSSSIFLSAQAPDSSYLPPFIPYRTCHTLSEAECFSGNQSVAVGLALGVQSIICCCLSNSLLTVLSRQLQTPETIVSQFPRQHFHSDGNNERQVYAESSSLPWKDGSPHCQSLVLCFLPSPESELTL